MWSEIQYHAKLELYNCRALELMTEAHALINKQGEDDEVRP